MEYHELIGLRIKYLSRQRGISINKLAKMSDVPQSTISDIIHGRTKNPLLSNVHKIALGLGMTCSEFLDYKEFNDYQFDGDNEEETQDK